ncbi:MAG: histidinol-phosphate transaminase [Bacteroidia bacterium]|nr:histidinol-phosphate transaminase [Bacteroidia bacterium]
MPAVFDIQSLVRPHLLKLKPYSSARDEFTGEAEVFLDANENAFGSAADGAYNRYPDPLQQAVKAELAALKGLRPEQIFLGNGSDEAIDLLYRCFCEPGRDHALLMPPTYGMYQVSADVNRTDVVQVPLTPDFQIDAEEVVAALRPGTKLVFICSPNNPSGNCMDERGIELVLRHAPGLVVVDEAYIDFAPERSLVPFLSRWPNLVILQTFSKAWGMAGLRLGMAFAHPDLIAMLNKIKPPYNVNLLTQQLALDALRHPERRAQMVADLLEQRTQLREMLAALPRVQHIYPSDANFLLVRVDDANGLYQELIRKGIIVRNRSSVLHCGNCLRITVGTPEENAALAAAIKGSV